MGRRPRWSRQARPRLGRWLLLGVGGLLGVVALVAAAVAGLVWATLPGGDVNAALPGLSAPAAVEIDKEGIPRIRAANETDAAALLGFLHARERMFQMDLTRRSAAGELAELAGAVALPIDRMMRTLGVRQAAEGDLEGLPPETRAMVEAYTRGVNAWIDRRGRFAAAEYLLLGPPRAWAAVDCLLWAKAMGLFLSGNWRTELARAGLAGRMPPEVIRALWPGGLGGEGRPEAALPAGLPTGLGAHATRLAGLLPRFPDPFTHPESASNVWAVDGTQSATGAPLLAGDPHLGFALPSTWYLARIETPGLTLTGATAPGVPFLLLGQNGHIAWSFTNTGADVQDLFLETPAGPDAYETPDGPRPYAWREERIRVRGAPDEVLRVRSTRHGPVVSDLAGPDGPLLAASLANLMPGDTAAAGLHALNRARSLDEAAATVAHITAPVQNLIAADRSRIGFFVTGRVPVRRAGDGALPAPGADGSHDWTGWASGTALPQVITPASGRLVNGNERVAPPDFPVFLGRDWFGDWRAQRIRERLAAEQKHTPASFAAIQVDPLSPFARDLLPVLAGLPASGLARTARDLLRGWDGTMARDAQQPLIFQAWANEAARLLREQAGAPAGATAPAAELLAGSLAGCDCAALLARALETAVTALAAEHGPDPASWRWGAAHKAVFGHPLLRFVPVLGPLAGAAIESDGGDTTVLRAASGGRGFEALHGGAYRGVYDLAEPERSLFINAPGQSGHFASRLARHFLRPWRDGGMVTIPAVAPHVDVRLSFTPGNAQKR